MSYFRTREVDWRPTLVTSPYLYLFAAITLCCAISLVIMFQLSQPHGAFTFNKSPFIEGLVEFGPLLFAVFYGLLWTWIDHGIKRLEPWLQLSKSESGVTAEHSLLLEYSYMLTYFAPISALRRRHWSVACSATILVLISIGVTPLASAIISEKNILRSVDFKVRRATVLPEQFQKDNISRLSLILHSETRCV
ncbi:hypothetical protein FPQ18DRAFT_86225 [Pyronema domesticum]|nr:hypothetical protein FPQ18DRAFT_86225 [Pyronema domesticum]